MTSARFGVQAAFVVLLIVLVSWPEPRHVRAGGLVWREGGPLSVSRGGYAAGRYDPRSAANRRFEIGWGSASLQRTSAGMSQDALRRKLQDSGIEGRRKVVPSAAVLALGGRFNAVVGAARTALNAPVPFARVVLRSIESGLAEARATADEDGRFTFLDVLPSGYIVELLGANGSVVATSELVAVDAGEVEETTVRLPIARGLSSAFGTLAPTAAESVTAAVQDGIRARTEPARTISPQR